MEDGQTPFANWVKTNASTANMLSIIMLLFAAWAAVEIVTNVTGNEIPPVTGMETNNDPDDAQRTNNGAIIGLGAVAGTFGLVLQLLIPREESEVVELMPEDDDDIDDVVDDMMEDVESEDEDLDSESEEKDSGDEGDSLEEGEGVPEDEGEESQEEEAPEEKEKTPTKKRKF